MAQTSTSPTRASCTRLSAADQRLARDGPGYQSRQEPGSPCVTEAERLGHPDDHQQARSEGEQGYDADRPRHAEEVGQNTGEQCPHGIPTVAPEAVDTDCRGPPARVG